jgi:type I restriction enzyme S subunit
MKPPGWRESDLASVVSTLESGSRPKGGASVETGEVASLGGENIIQGGGVTLAQVKRVPLAFFKRMTKGHLANADILINKDGAQTGKVGIYLEDGGPACINEHVFLIRGDKKQICQDLLYYTLLSEPGQRQIAAQISGSAQPGLKASFLKGVLTKVPDSLFEQEKIAEILATVDRAMVQTEAQIAKQQRIKMGLMQDLLTRGIDEHGALRSESTDKFKSSPLGRIPEHWDVQSLAQLTTKIVDGVHHTPAYVETGIPFIVITDLTGSSEIDFSNTRFISPIDHREFARRADPKPGDVLVTKDGTLGIARVVGNQAPEFSIFVSVAMLRPKAKVCLPELIWAFFESGKFLAQLGALSAGTGLSHIHLEHFRSFLLLRPPIDEQRNIFRVINRQQGLLDNLTSGWQKLRKQRAALLQDLLTGGKRVTPLMESGQKRERMHAQR